MPRAQKKSLPRSAVHNPTISRDDVAREAIKLFQARHGAPGDPVADWFEAERIVKARMVAPPTRQAEAAAARGSNNGRRRGTTRRR